MKSRRSFLSFSCVILLAAWAAGEPATGATAIPVTPVPGPVNPGGPDRDCTCVSALPDCKKIDETVGVDLSTGTSQIGSISVGTADPKWTLISVPANSNLQPGVAYAINTPSPWVAPPTPAQWIQPWSGTDAASSTGGVFVYRMIVYIPQNPYYYDSIAITGSFGADDDVIITVNGNVIGSCTGCFGAMHPFNTAQPYSYFQPGYNVIEATVSDTGSVYSGLALSAKLEAKCSKCTSPPPDGGGTNPPGPYPGPHPGPGDWPSQPAKTQVPAGAMKPVGH